MKGIDQGSSYEGYLTFRGLEPQSNATRAQTAQMLLNYDVFHDSPSLPESVLKQLRERPFFQETAYSENDQLIVLGGYLQRRSGNTGRLLNCNPASGSECSEAAISLADSLFLWYTFLRKC